MASKFGVDEFFSDVSLFPSEEENGGFTNALIGLANVHPLFLLRPCTYAAAGNLPSSPEDDDTQYDEEPEDEDDDVWIMNPPNIPPHFTRSFKHSSSPPCTAAETAVVSLGLPSL